MEHYPFHPHAGKVGGQIEQHRLVVECFLGRLLEKNEVVHHVNRDKLDNRFENLKVLSRHEHGLEHRQESIARESAPLTEEMVRNALVGKTTLEAASILEVHHQTLRNRFDHLLTKRTSPLGDYDPEFVEAVRQLAADPEIGTRKAVKILGKASLTIRQCCKRHGIVWQSARRGRPSRDDGGIYLPQAKKPSPFDADNPEFVKKVSEVAADPEIGMSHAVKLLGASAARIRTCCTVNRIQWASPPSGRPSRDRLKTYDLHSP
jgi:hypothetical protein